MDTATVAWRPCNRAATLASMSKPSPETITIIAVGATLLIAVCSVGIGLGMLWSSGQARMDASISEWQFRTDTKITHWQDRTDTAIAELRHDIQDVRERLARLEAIILARHAPSSGVSDG